MNEPVKEGLQLENVPDNPQALFGTSEPEQVLANASRVADVLKGVIVKKGMFAKIKDKNYVTAEGWTTLGSMLGVTAVITKTGPTAEEDGFKARAEARNSEGRVIGAAEAICTKKEKTWANRDDYALLGMAQTRAISRALRGPLGFVVKLANYEAASAEEMPKNA